MTIDAVMVTIVLAMIAGAIAWGTLRETVRVNHISHCELAADLRPRLSRMEEAVSTRKAEHDTLEERLRGFKEQLDRIEGVLSSSAPQPKKRART